MKAALDDDVFYALTAAYHGHLLEARAYQKLVRMGFAMPRGCEGRRTWLTERGREAFLVEDRRRDALPSLPSTMVVEEDDEPAVGGRRRPSGTYKVVR